MCLVMLASLDPTTGIVPPTVTMNLAAGCGLLCDPPVRVTQRRGQYHTWTCSAARFQTGLCQLGIKTRIPPFWAYVSFFRQLRTWRCQCFRRLVPIADLSRCSNVLRLLDHLVGDGEHPGREGETEHLRSLEIDHKLKLGRL